MEQMYVQICAEGRWGLIIVSRGNDEGGDEEGGLHLDVQWAKISLMFLTVISYGNRAKSAHCVSVLYCGILILCS